MKKKASAFAAALTLSTMLAVPVFAENTGTGMNSTGYGAGSSPGVYGTPSASSAANMTGTPSAYSSPGHTYSNTTGVGNYTGTGATGTTGAYGTTGTGAVGNAVRNTTRSLATDNKNNVDWGWLGLLGLVGLAGLMGRSRDTDRDRVK